MYRILTTVALLTLAGCSGGNAGSSSGSGGADPDTADNTDETTAINAGNFSGNVNFTGLNSSATIDIDIDDDGNVTVTSSDTGSTTGTVSGDSFTTTGIIGFNLGNQVCSGFTTISGNGSTTGLSGTVSAISAECIENDVLSSIDLDGTFTAN